MALEETLDISNERFISWLLILLMIARRWGACFLVSLHYAMPFAYMGKHWTLLAFYSWFPKTAYRSVFCFVVFSMHSEVIRWVEAFIFLLYKQRTRGDTLAPPLRSCQLADPFGSLFEAVKGLETESTFCNLLLPNFLVRAPESDNHGHTLHIHLFER